MKPAATGAGMERKQNGFSFFFLKSDLMDQGSSHSFERWKVLSCRDPLGK